jgi:ribosomal protein L29
MKRCHHDLSALDAFLNNGRCVQCNREKGRRFYQNHKEKVLEKCAEWRQLNPEKVAEIRKKYKARLASLRFQQNCIPKENMAYANKLKTIIYEIGTIEGELEQFIRFTSTGIDQA